MLVARGAFHVFIAATSLPEARTARRYVRSRLESIWIDLPTAEHASHRGQVGQLAKSDPDPVDQLPMRTTWSVHPVHLASSQGDDF
jgi:hypothetical protein